MGEKLEAFVRWLSEALAPFSQAVADGVRWAIDALGTLVPPALAAGHWLAPVLLLAVPGIAMYGAMRLVSVGTEKLFGRTDALLTSLVFAAAMGFVFGWLFAIGWGAGQGHIAAVSILLATTAVGFFLGVLRTFGPRMSSYLTIALVAVANISGAFIALY